MSSHPAWFRTRPRSIMKEKNHVWVFTLYGVDMTSDQQQNHVWILTLHGVDHDLGSL